MKIVVYHSYYGCDTGCCGHTVEMGDKEHFEFAHPGVNQDPLDFAREMVIDAFGAEHVEDLDWANCIILDD